MNTDDCYLHAFYFYMPWLMEGLQALTVIAAGQIHAGKIRLLWRDICGITGKITFRQLMGLLLIRGISCFFSRNNFINLWIIIYLF